MENEIESYVNELPKFIQKARGRNWTKIPDLFVDHCSYASYLKDSKMLAVSLN